MPLLIAMVTSVSSMVTVVSIACLFGLAALGAIGAKAGGAELLKPTMRVMFWGAFAMAATAAIGKLFGTATV